MIEGGILTAAEVGKELLVAPTLVPSSSPGIVVVLQATDVEQTVQSGGTSQDLPTRPCQASAIQP